MAEPNKKPPEIVASSVKGKVTIKKKNIFQRFISDLISDDVSNIKGNIYQKIVLPMTRKLITDTLKNAVDMTFLGELRSGSSYYGETRNNYNKISSWRKYYENEDKYYDTQSQQRSRVVYDIGETTYANKEDAEAVLNDMNKLLSDYGVVTVAQYLQFSGLSHCSNDHDFGWSSISDAKIVPVSTDVGLQWTIRLPRPLPLK